jgi:chemotaxis protein methyltransferase CheR
MVFNAGERDDAIMAVDFLAIRDFLKRSCGLVVGDNKQYLVKSRLTPLLGKFNLASFAELAVRLQANDISSYPLKNAVIDAMTTNETYWFRDETQFNELRNRIIPRLLAAGGVNVDIWSAACSSGQEPYSVSMCLSDSATAKRIQIVATDISPTMLALAENGLYSDLAMSRGISAEQKAQFFHKTDSGYQINSLIKQRVRFQSLNLMESFVGMGTFDIIFCRNVLIYFADPVKQDILQRMVACLKPGGILFLSSTESMPGAVQNLKLVNGSFANYYQKVA